MSVDIPAIVILAPEPWFPAVEVTIPITSPIWYPVPRSPLTDVNATFEIAPVVASTLVIFNFRPEPLPTKLKVSTEESVV